MGTIIRTALIIGRIGVTLITGHTIGAVGTVTIATLIATIVGINLTE
jgi:hypothetical protein